MSLLAGHRSEPALRMGQKLLQINWVLVLLLSLSVGLRLGVHHGHIMHELLLLLLLHLELV